MSYKHHGALLQQEENFEYFTFPDLLETHTLIYNPSLGVLSRVYNADPYPRIQGEQQFTTQELALLLPLLRSYPHYAPYELLFASFCYGVENTTEKRIEDARTFLYRAMDEEIWDAEMRPLRNVMARVRAKTRCLGFSIVALLETGYTLQKPRKQRESLKNEVSISENA